MSPEPATAALLSSAPHIAPPVEMTAASSQGWVDVLLLTEDAGTHLVRALAGLHANVVVANSVAEAESKLSHRTAALVVDAPMPTRSAEEVLDALARLDPARRLPVFFVVGDAFTDQRARDLYDGGAAAVVSWPSEVLVLPRLVSELMNVTLADNEATPVDAALGEAIAARIAVDPELSEVISCRVFGATAIISGAVDSLWKHRRIRAMIETVPGVVGIIDDGLLLEPAEVADDELTQTLETMLKFSAAVNAETLSTSIDSGKVTLAGVVGSKREFRSLETLVENVRGVRSVRNLVTISARAAAANADAAHKLQETIAVAFPQTEVSVSVFGDAVVLTGTVRTLATRSEIRDMAEDSPVGGRVVNKLSVVA